LVKNTHFFAIFTHQSLL